MWEKGNEKIVNRKNNRCKTGKDQELNSSKVVVKKNLAALGWLAQPVGLQPPRVRIPAFALTSLIGVRPQIKLCCLSCV